MKYCGVDYYPEQWGLDLLDQDMKDMKELGVNLIRIADFAWDVIEPEDGKYSFEFFDEVIKRMKAEGFKIMFSVPTATMPSWLYAKHPDIMNVDENGYRQPYGGRRGYCVNNDYYIKKGRALAHEIAKHYKDEDAIVAIQIDNEICDEGSDLCFCDSCKDKFHTYLKNKYQNIDELNKRWGTCFWTQTYHNFDDIPLPRKAFVAHNPSLKQEYYRFRAVSTTEYLKGLYDTVKEECDIPVTHDFEGGTFNKFFDPYEISKNLDFVSYNNYPVWGGQTEPLPDSTLAFNVEFARSFKKKPIWITESIMGAQGHNDIGCAPKPGEAKKWAIDSLKHGVESLIFFRYRGFTKGAEQYCYGIIDSDNEKRRKYYETKSFFEEYKDKETIIPESKVCLVYDYGSKCSMNVQRQSNNFDYKSECLKMYEQFFKRDISVDIVNSKDRFEDYKMVLLPYMIIMSDEYKQRLKEYVKNGGTVIMSPRTAWKDLDNNLVFGKRIPVDLVDLTGVKLEEHEALNDDTYYEVNLNGKTGKGRVFVEMMNVTTAKRYGEYVHNPFGDFGVVFENEYGKGRCYYLSSSLDETLMDETFDMILNKSNL